MFLSLFLKERVLGTCKLLELVFFFKWHRDSWWISLAVVLAALKSPPGLSFGKAADGCLGCFVLREAIFL